MKSLRLGMCAAAIAAAAGAASATPLRLDYCVDALGGGQYRYTFHLVLDNNDGSWAPGQGFGWITFGDTQQQTSPFAGFVMDPASFPIGPYTELDGSGGYHNGPTLGPVVLNEPPNYPPNLWVPNAVGDQLTWTGTAGIDLEDGQLLFSNLLTGNGANSANFVPANRSGSCAGAPTGACCRPDGSCAIFSSANCTADGGVYHGNGTSCGSVSCPQPPTGSCCTDSGCFVLSAAQCTSHNGVYHGDNSPCSTAGCAPATAWTEQGDANEVPSTAQVVSGSGALQVIHGRLSNFLDADMYKIRICDPTDFSAALTGLSIGELFLFDANGVGVTERLGLGGPATLTNQFTSSLPAGDYYLAVGPFLKLPQDASGLYLWMNNHFDNIERRPDGDGAANPIDHWDAGGGVDGAYDVALTGACFVGTGPTCYANCDHSTTVPFLNVNDFVCFQTKFAAGDSYANCDGSTTPPVLNVNDFVCFQTRFAAGCSAP